MKKAEQKMGDGGTKNGEVQRTGQSSPFPHSAIPTNPAGAKPSMKDMPKAGAVRGGKYTRSNEGRQPYEPGHAVKTAMMSQNTASAGGKKNGYSG